MNRPQREITIIPAIVGNALQGSRCRQLRVASYSRVSTDFEEQISSFHAQKAYYTDLIMKNSEWTLAGTYADEGLSGANAEKRPEFQRMIRHCQNGKIDLIITKSISRFARNTMDSVGYVRKLKAMGVGVIFEKENINTLEQNSEVIFTILSSLAQEELMSISQNVKNGFRMRAEQGELSPMLERLYGFRKLTDSEYEIIPQQAKVVKQIYRRYLMGYSDAQIVRELNEDKITSKTKKSAWSNSTVQSILTNEKYCGDILFPKSIVTDPITKKVKKNNGEFPQVYIKNNHEGIVSREIFQQAQQERARRNSKKKVSQNTVTEQGKYSSAYALTDILICGHCGTPYRRTTWRKRNGDKQVVWRCINRLEYGRKYCKDSVTVDEESLKQTIINALRESTMDSNGLIPILNAHIERALWHTAGGQVNIEEIESRMEKLKKDTMELMSQSIANNTVVENEARLKAMNDEIMDLYEMVVQYKENNSTKNTISKKLKEYTEFLRVDTAESDTYNDTLVRQLIHTIKVMDDYITIYFKNGTEWTQPMDLKVRRLRK